MEILEAKGYAENDVNMRYYLGRCKVKRHNEAERKAGNETKKDAGQMRFSGYFWRRSSKVQRLNAFMYLTLCNPDPLILDQ